jgi:uncharacterized protein
MSDTLRDQLLGLGFKPAPKPDKPRPAADGGKGGGRGVHPSREGDRRPRPPREGDSRPRPPRAGEGRPRPAPGDRRGPPGKGAKTARSREDIDLAKAYAIRAQREKDERIEAERRKQEEARLRREARAKVAALVAGQALNDPAADIARHFEYGGKIKRVYVTADQLKALNTGELGVLQLDGRYHVVTAALLAEAEALFAPAVALKVDPAAPAADDPYADPKYQVPDDLVW